MTKESLDSQLLAAGAAASSLPKMCTAKPKMKKIEPQRWSACHWQACLARHKHAILQANA